MDLQAATTVAYNLVTSSAVIIGGVWAYFKFVRGRTFASRAELSVSATLKESPGRLYLCIIVALKNTGLSKLPLNNNMKAIRIFAIERDAGDRPGETEWERIITLPLLEQHEWLEAQETVTDTVVYRLPAPGYRAYQVEAIVGARRRPITRKRVQWQARAVIFPPLADSSAPWDARAVSKSISNGSLIQRIAKLRKERRLGGP